MRNETRMYLCEVLLHWILYLVPKNDNGLRLVKAIEKYTKKEMELWQTTKTQ